MAKKVTTRLQHTKWEATLTNLRASQKRLDKVDRKVSKLLKLVDSLGARVAQLAGDYEKLRATIAGR